MLAETRELITAWSVKRHLNRDPRWMKDSPTQSTFSASTASRSRRDRRAKGVWDELFPAEQACIVALRVERSTSARGAHLRLRVDGLSGL